jgi:exodeoxyribonuclease VII large subunit
MFANGSQTVPGASGSHLTDSSISPIDYTAAVRNAEFQRKIYSVTELSGEIRDLLERRFIDVWVEGELSNFKPSTAGHLYFTLKDDRSQLRAVCFRNSARLLRFRPENGKLFRARGRVSTYEERGEYQLIVEVLEPAGLGALQLAFEQLKEKLEKEGLFKTERKRPIPAFPAKDRNRDVAQECCAARHSYRPQASPQRDKRFDLPG